MAAVISSDQEDIRLMDAETFVKKDGISVLKILISPIQDLPNELISQIFEQYAHGPCPTTNSDRQPWYLGHICSRWRKVALATPNLWNFFVLPLYYLHPTKSPSLEPTLELLRRTGNSPISCSFRHPRYSISMFIKWGFTFLSQHASLLRCLTIDCVNGSSLLEDISGVSLVSLETLDMSLYMVDSEFAYETTPKTLFNESPNLRRVLARVKTHHYTYIDLLSLGLPWDQLTHLHLSGTGGGSYRSVYTVLSQCSSLVDCSLSIPRDRCWGDTEVDPITLPHLGTLKIIYDTYGGTGQFLRYIICPSLKRLTVAIEYALDEVVGFIQRSGCSLTEIKLATCESESLMFDLLRKTPSVKRF